MPKKKSKNWINPNPAHKGELIGYVHDTYGEHGFTRTGRIKKSVLREMVHKGNSIQPYNHQALFALNVGNLRRR